MNQEVGYVKTFRTSKNHWLYHGTKTEPFDRWHAWMDLLLSANFKMTKKRFKGKLQVTYAGQLQTSIPTLAKRWCWSEGKVRRFLDALDDDGMIGQSRTIDGTTITIENWRKYQIDECADDSADDSACSSADDSADRSSGRRHKKNVKKDKNDKNPPNPPEGGNGGGVICDPNDPDFDAEAFLEKLGECNR